MHILCRPFQKSAQTIISLVVVLVFTSALTGCKFKQENAFLYRGPAPSMKRLRELKAMGIKTVVSVRNDPSKRKAAYAEKIGLKWMTVKTSVMHSPKEQDIRKFINIVNNPANQPIYVCCVGGRDRSVFYVTAYKIAVEGADPEKLLENLEGSTWHKLWPGFRYYVDILRNGAKSKYGWTPQIMNASEGEPAEEEPPKATSAEAKSI